MYHPDLHIALTPYLNPLVDGGMQTDTKEFSESTTMCEILCGRDIAAQQMHWAIFHVNRSKVTACFNDWRGNSEKECYLKRNVRKLFARELNRKCEELNTKHLAERSAQAVLLHGHCQTTHMAALALKDQLEQCEYIGRVMVCRSYHILLWIELSLRCCGTSL